jgi:hypothetical protein
LGFNESVDIARVGERVVRDYLDDLDTTKAVIDIRHDTRFMGKDIDFMVYTTKKQIYYVEVKTDFKAHETGNMVYEVHTSGEKGCLAKTEADYIFYYVYGSKTLYVIDRIKLQSYVNSFKHLKLIKMGDRSDGYLLPLSVLEEHKVVVKKVTNLD